ncbi:T9SS type A sorting domain-containing protein [Hymenobacter pini]|uniref:T9SS type A sorting domain-containing protein n=1 Tax=Hymenobacter pini TaxID=2880879 RepID=UPI001CF35954|nr:T9SS type A sorting domain-containing protein [Hymenobacter pini]MCA8829884.1 IPT/TIG domain-containing protein [Hymenobacter pini]
MKKTQLMREGFRRISVLLWLLLSGLALQPLRAQEACLLEPVPLAQRIAQAPLVVEAWVQNVRSVNDGNHIVTLNALEVFKVFRGSLPAGTLTLQTLGGTVGLRREEVSNEPVLAAGEQAVFLLEANPTAAGTYRLVAGPQGLLRYDLGTATASDPFRRYNSIPAELYPELMSLTNQNFRLVRPNAPLEARLQQASRPGAAATISGFSPATVTAGTRTVLTITGSGFGATQGSSTVGFSNANNGGTSYVVPLATDYLSWSDTEIRVRVPGTSMNNAGPAGTGKIQLTIGGATALSPEALTVNYALANVNYQDNAYPVAMVGTNGAGGYTLTYNQAFAANTAAVASFGRALAVWRNGVGANRIVAAATTAINTNASDDNVNVVSFDDATELPTGVLGVTYSYYSGCSSNGAINWVLTGTDYIFDGERNWQFGPAAPTGGQFDFESVVLHEQGHGIQLGHIIKPGAVMHYAIAANTQNRVLNATNDVAGAAAEIEFSLTAPRCGNPAYARLAAAVPLPVTLLSFTAERNGTEVEVRWQTAAELGSAYFAVETTLDPTGQWQELTRLPAAGSSTMPRTYRYLNQAAPGMQHYYRLRQIDTDGSQQYSAVAKVGPVSGAATFSAYPNPFTDQLRIQLPVPVAGELRLFDMAGRLQQRQTVTAGSAEVSLPTVNIRPGVYVLEWQPQSGPRGRVRVVKQ